MAKFNPTGTALVYSTLLGEVYQVSPPNGSQSEAGYAIAMDSGGKLYVSGSTTSPDFPTTPGAYNTQTVGSFLTKLTTIPVLPDFNNDGFTDLLIQNASTNQIASWFMQGAHWVGGAYFSLTPPGEYALVGTGDFQGNGATTLVLQSRTTNRIAYWYTGGANLSTIIGGQFVDVTPDSGWKVVGVGDFNGDGKSDLVFQNQTSGWIAIWFMDGAFRRDGVLLPYAPVAGWSVAGAGDFNKDGFFDLVFQNQTTNQAVVWYLQGGVHMDGESLSLYPPPGWKIVGPR